MDQYAGVLRDRRERPQAKPCAVSPTGSLREQRAELAARLIEEYAGLVPPGRVLAAVARTTRALRRAHVETDWLELCESGARRRIAAAGAQRAVR